MRWTKPRSAKWSWLAAVAMALCSAAGCGTGAPPPPDEAVWTTAQPLTNSLLADKLDDAVRRYMAHPRTVGLAVAVTKDDAILWSTAQGSADPTLGIPFTTRTPIQIASVQKMITATAFMQLWERGVIGLDDDVNDYLPFKVRNPSHPGVPITFRMLLSHASSINDNWERVPYYFGTDSPIPLDRYLRDYFDPKVAGYDASWLAVAPGTTWWYSNIGFELVGLVIERVTRLPYGEYIRRNLLDPLGMHGSLYLSGFGPGDVQPAVPTAYDPVAKRFVPYGQYTVSLLASGMLMTDVESLTRFLLARVNGGATAGYPRIIGAEANALMAEGAWPYDSPIWGPYVPYYGLGLLINNDYGFGTVEGHEGGDMGLRSWAFYTVEDRIGVVLLTNGEAYLAPLVEDLTKIVRAHR